MADIRRHLPRVELFLYKFLIQFDQYIHYVSPGMPKIYSAPAAFPVRPFVTGAPEPPVRVYTALFYYSRKITCRAGR